MKYRIITEARIELLDAGRYYARIDRQLLANLKSEFDRALHHLLEFPLASKPLDTVYRSFNLRRFPYQICYRLDGDILVIVAFAHTSRKQDYWRERVE